MRLASTWSVVLHGINGVLVEIEERSILQTCRYLEERQGAVLHRYPVASSVGTLNIPM
ncbi:MAG: hypothetical protein ACRDRO_26605 [Pseudonocardiaceae bacterium]